MPDPSLLLVLSRLLPLAGAVLCTLFGAVAELRRWAHLPAVVCAGLSCVRAPGRGVPRGRRRAGRFPGDGRGLPVVRDFPRGTRLVVEAALSADQLAGVMLLAVTFIGFWIVVFSIGYMHGSPGFPRYFAVVSLFLAAMTLLVLADNFLLMFAGWEGVGLCSYLLIGYWHHKPSAADAARKAFLVTRLGDVGLILGIFVLWWVDRADELRLRRGLRPGRGLRADDPSCSRPPACCSCAGRSASRPSSRCTSGCPTQWRARPRCPPSSTRPPW